MDYNTFTVEHFLTNLQTEILDLRVIVSNLYNPRAEKQSELFDRYEEILSRKTNDYMAMKLAFQHTVA